MSTRDGPCGTDAVMGLDEAEAERLVGPLAVTVDCECGHRVAFGACCPQCHRACLMPGDPKRD